MSHSWVLKRGEYNPLWRFSCRAVGFLHFLCEDFMPLLHHNITCEIRSPYIIIIGNSPCTKAKRSFPITPERRRICYNIAITIHILVTATIFHFPPSAGFVFLLNPAEGLTSIETNFKSFLCTLNDFLFSPTTVNGIYGLDFSTTVPPITTSPFLSKERKNNFDLHFQPSSFLYILLFHLNFSYISW